MDLEKELPWRQWFLDRLGWTEVLRDEELSKGWVLTKYCKKFKTVIGAKYSWCGMSLATALDSCGYQYPEACERAEEWKTCGLPIAWKTVGIPKGAIVVIKHPLGGHHVTTSDEDHTPGEIRIACLGGNQGNAIKRSIYNVSGKEHGHDEVVAVRMPIQKI